LGDTPKPPVRLRRIIPAELVLVETELVLVETGSGNPAVGRVERSETHRNYPNSTATCHCEPFSKLSEEKARQSTHSSDDIMPPRDCFVASLLAMTPMLGDIPKPPLGNVLLPSVTARTSV
jgi:hypothetical protein